MEADRAGMEDPGGGGGDKREESDKSCLIKNTCQID